MYNEKEFYYNWIKLISNNTNMYSVINHLSEHLKHSKDLDFSLNDRKWFLSLFNILQIISVQLISEKVLDTTYGENIDYFTLNEILYNKSFKYNNDFEKTIQQAYYENH